MDECELLKTLTGILVRAECDTRYREIKVMSDAEAMQSTADKFGYPDTLIAETPSWLVLLRPQQVTLGAVVLLCREPVEAFGAVSAEALAGLNPLIGHLENVLSDFSGYEKINYLMLMMVDPAVHFHVIPRYEADRTFGGLTFPDAGWPGPPALDRAVKLDDEARHALTLELRERWNACVKSPSSSGT